MPPKIIPDADPGYDPTTRPARPRPRGSIDGDPAPVAVAERPAPQPDPSAPKAKAPSPPRPGTREHQIAEINSLRVGSTPAPAAAPEFIPERLEDCKTHRHLELYYARQAGLPIPPAPCMGIANPMAPPAPVAVPAPEGKTKKVLLIVKEYRADDKRLYRKGDVAELPEREADLLIAAKAAEFEPDDVWIGTLVATGIKIIGDVLTRRKPIKVGYRMAMELLHPKPDPSGRIHPDKAFGAKVMRSLTEAEAQAWDPDKVKRPDPRPPVGQSLDPRAALPRVLVKNTAGPMVGHYATCTGGELEMDEESAVQFSLLKFPPTHEYCLPKPWDDKPRVRILGELSEQGKVYLEKLKRWIETQPTVNPAGQAISWNPASRNIPRHPLLTTTSTAQGA
jgi:hypothetical protein